MKFTLSVFLLIVILLTACSPTPSSTPLALSSDFQQSITPPYEKCETDADHTPSEASGSSKILETGFSSVTSLCDAERGVINYSVIVFGGKNGNVNKPPDQEANASGDMQISFKSPFTGNLRIEATLAVNSKTGAAAGSATVLKDFKEIILEFIVPENLGAFLDIAKAFIGQTFAGVRTEAFVSADTGTFQKKATALIGGHGFGASFPIAPNSQNGTFDDEQVVVSLIAPVVEGQTVLITTGLSTTAKAYGWATSYWNPRHQHESFVKFVSLTGEFASENLAISPQENSTLAEEPSPTATSTSLPTSTITLTATSTPMPTDTATVPPTSTNTLEPVTSLRGTVLQRSQCRYGPSQYHLFKTGFKPQAPVEVIGRDADGDWLHIQLKGRNEPCWINAKLVQVDGEVMNLPDEYPPDRRLQTSDDFEQITITSISPSASGVVVAWAPHTIRPDLVEPDAVEYIVEVWTCVDGKPAFYAVGTNDTFATIQIDNSCGIASHADVIGQDQHGFSPPAIVSLP